MERIIRVITIIIRKVTLAIHRLDNELLDLIVAYVRKPFLAKIKDVSYPIPFELPVTTTMFSAFICIY